MGVSEVSSYGLLGVLGEFWRSAVRLWGGQGSGFQLWAFGTLLRRLGSTAIGFHDPVPGPQEPQYAIESGTMRLVRRLWDAVTPLWSSAPY